jgi:WD40 repeat protein
MIQNVPNSFIIGILFSLQHQTIEGFLSTTNTHKGWTMTAETKHRKQHTHRGLFQTFDDFEEYPNDFPSTEQSEKKDEDIFAALRARQDYLSSFGTSSSSSISGSSSGTSRKSEDELETMSKWKNAECTSTIRIQLNDWVRRLAIDTYPLGVCGSANGSVYLLDLERGEELDCVPGIHDGVINDEDVEEAMTKMFGKYDGGGVIAIAIKDDVVVSAGREGGLQIFKIDGEETNYYKGSRGGSATSTKLNLKSEGMLFYLVSTLVTSMAFDNIGNLWVGSYDGFIRAFEYDDKKRSLVQQNEPTHEIDVGSEVLSVSINDDIGCGVAATLSGEVILFSLEEGEEMARWKPFGYGVGKRKREFARTAILVQNDEADESSEAVWSVIAGGSEGSLFQRRLNVDVMGYIADSNPMIEDEALIGRFRPSPTLSVVSLSSPFPGLLVSGSQDGNIRVWDCSYHRSNDDDTMIISDGGDDEDGEAQCDDIGGLDKRPRCLYALTGFKVWLGSIFTNGKKMVSDGADNAIVVHNFSDEDDGIQDFLFEEDDDLEDFSDFD